MNKVKVTKRCQNLMMGAKIRSSLSSLNSRLTNHKNLVTISENSNVIAYCASTLIISSRLVLAVRRC